jgi:flagellar hook-associated protein 1 FlgK
MEDSGQFLTGYSGVLVDSGPDGAFRWDQQDGVLALRGGDLDYAVAPLTHPSGWIEINPELFEEPAAIAAGLGYDGKASEVGNGDAAVAIASLRNQPVMLGQTLTFDDYFADTVASIGLRGEEAEIALDTQELIMKDLRDMRESISGVNIDEEFSQLIRYQHGYSAAARFVSEFNTMLDTLINRMGV